MSTQTFNTFNICVCIVSSDRSLLLENSESLFPLTLAFKKISKVLTYHLTSVNLQYSYLNNKLGIIFNLQLLIAKKSKLSCFKFVSYHAFSNIYLSDDWTRHQKYLLIPNCTRISRKFLFIIHSTKSFRVKI